VKNKNYHNVNVVVVGAGVNALGVMRSIGNSFNSLLVTPKKSIVSHTKYGMRFYVNSTTERAIVESLVTLGKQLSQRCVLLLTEEVTVAYVSEYRKELSEYFIIDFPSHELLIALQSKLDFQHLAEKNGAPIPRAVCWTAQNNKESLETLDFPCVFKPLRQDAAYSKQFKKAYKVASSQEVDTLYEQISPVLPDMITQEWIEGDDSDIYFNIVYFDKNSYPISAFTGRKLRSWPRGIGGTASCVDAPESHIELTQHTTAFAKSVGFTGLMGMEYKYDTQRQSYYMIEPTVGRTDYQHEIATLSGTNMLVDICSYLLNKTTSDLTKEKQLNAHASTMWFDEIADANSIAHGSPTFDELKVARYAAVHRWNDMGPYLFRLKNRVMTRLKNIF